MSKQRFELQFDARMNVEQIKTATSQMEAAFSKIKLPGNLGSALTTTIAKLKTELENFDDITSKTFTSMADVNKATKSYDNILSYFEKMKVEMAKVKGLDPEKFLPKATLDKLKTLNTQLGKVGSAAKANQAAIEKETKAYQDQVAVVDKLKKEIQAKEAALNSNRGKKGANAKRMDEIETDLAQKKATAASIKTSAKAAGKNIEEDVDYQALQLQIKNLTTEYNNLFRANDKLSESLRTGKLEIDQLKAKQQEAQTTAQGLKTNLENLSKVKPEGLQQIREEIAQLKGVSIDQVTTDVTELAQEIQNIPKEKFSEMAQHIMTADITMEELEQELSEGKQKVREFASSAEDIQNMANQVGQLRGQMAQFFTLTNGWNLLKRTIQQAKEAVQEYDAAMTEIAVVSDYDLGEVWGMAGKYAKDAHELGASTMDVINAQKLYIQQGLDMAEANEISTETIKMARIANIDGAKATELMTAAIRGFNLEMSESARVNDVFSELAAKTAADTEQIAVALSKTASIANSAGASLENTSAFLAQIIETTQEAPETAGTALKTIIARFQELKKPMSEIGEVDGEMVDANKIESALRQAGVALRDTNGEFRNFDDVILELAGKWDGLDVMTQRYIATMAAGSRQQSRFLALMSDSERLTELSSMAMNSAGSSQKQFEKTLESLETAANRLSVQWERFITTLANETIIKTVIDLISNFLKIINDVIEAVGKLGGEGEFGGIIKSILAGLVAFGAFKAGGALVNQLFSSMVGPAKLGGQQIGAIIGDEIATRMGAVLNVRLPQEVHKAQAKAQAGAGGLGGKGTVIGGKEVKTNSIGTSLNNLRKEAGFQKTTMDPEAQKIKSLLPQIKEFNKAEAEYIKIAKDKNSSTQQLIASYTRYADLSNDLYHAAKRNGASQQQLNNIIQQSTKMDSLKIGTAHQSLILTNAETAAKAQEILANEALSDSEKRYQIEQLAGQGIQRKSLLFMAAEKAQKLGLILLRAQEWMLQKLGIQTGNQEAKTKLLQGVAEKGLTKEKWASAAATWAQLGPLLLIVATIAVLIGLIALLCIAIEDDSEKTKRLTEELDRAGKTAEEASSRLNDMMSARDGYDDLHSQLEDLTKGTAEWKQALWEANSQVLELLDTYPELSEYITKNADGVLEISDEGWNNVIESQQKAVGRANAAKFAKQTELNQHTNKVERSNIITKLDSAIYTPGEGRGVIDTKPFEAFTAIQDKIQNNPEFFADSDKVKEFADSLGLTVQELKDFRKEIEDHNQAVISEELRQQQANQMWLDTYGTVSSEENGQIMANAINESLAEKMSGADYEKEIDELAKKMNVGNYISQNNEDFKEMAKYYGAETDTSGDKDDDRNSIKAVYAEAMGVSEAEISDNLSEEEMLEAIAAAYQGDKILDQQKAMTKAMETMGKEDQRLFSAIMTDSKDMSYEMLQELTTEGGEFNAEKLEDFQKVLGYSTEEMERLGLTQELIRQEWEESRQAWSDLDNELSNCSEATKVFYDGLKTAGMTLSQAEAFKETAQAVEERGGDIGILGEKRNEYLAGITDNNTRLKEEQLFHDTDWTSQSSIYEYVKELRKLGVELDGTVYQSLVDATKAASDFSMEHIQQQLQSTMSVINAFSTRAAGDRNYNEDLKNDLINRGSASEQDFIKLSNGEYYYKGDKTNTELLTTTDNVMDPSQTADKVKEYTEAKKIVEQGTAGFEALKTQGAETLSRSYGGYLVRVDSAGDYEQVSTDWGRATGQVYNAEKDASEALLYSKISNNYGAESAKVTETDLEADYKKVISALGLEDTTEGKDNYGRFSEMARVVTQNYDAYLALVKESAAEGAKKEEEYNNAQKVLEGEAGFSKDQWRDYYSSTDLSAISDNFSKTVDTRNRTYGEAEASGDWTEWHMHNNQLQAMNEALIDQAILYGVDAASIEEYSQATEEDRKELVKNLVAKTKAAKAEKAFQAGIKATISGLEEYDKLVSKESKINALQNMVKTMGLSLKVDENNYETVYGLLQQIAEGSYEAYLELIQLTASSYGIEVNYNAEGQFAIDTTQFEDATADTKKKWDAFIDEMGESGQWVEQEVEIESSGYYPVPDPAGGYTLKEFETGQKVTILRPKTADMLQESVNLAGGGSSGGGGSDTPWESSYDYLHNLVQETNKLLRGRNKLEREYTKLLEKEGASAQDLYENSQKQLQNLAKQKEYYDKQKAGRENKLQEYINEYADVREYVYIEDGMVKLNQEQLEALSGQDGNNELGERIDEAFDKMTEAVEQIEEVEDSLDEIDDTAKEIKKTGKDNAIALEGRIKDALVQKMQEEIDAQQELSEAISTANSEMLDRLQTNLEEYRSQRDMEEKAEDISDMEGRLALLRSTNADPTEILKLEEELAKSRQDYTDSLIDKSIDEMTKQNEEAQKQREKQIELQQLQLEENQKNGEIARQANEIFSAMLRGDTESLRDLLKETDNFAGMTATEQKDWEETFQEQYADAGNYWLNNNNLKDLGYQAGQSVSFYGKNETYTEGTVSSDGQYVISKDRTKKWSIADIYRDSTGAFRTNIASTAYQQPTQSQPVSSEPASKPITNGSRVRLTNNKYTSHASGYTSVAGTLGVGIGYEDTVQQLSANGKAALLKNIQSWVRLQDLEAFATGGLADFTGPAWLDGTKSRPEYVLNASQTQGFLGLVNILESLKSNKTEAPRGDNYYSIDIHVDELGNDYDVDQLIERIKENIEEDAAYRNVNAVDFGRR